jgi:pimeloyl-ACP methyl ester carboxylesterase
MKYVLLLLCFPASAQARLVLISTREAPTRQTDTTEMRYWVHDREWKMVSRSDVIPTRPLIVFAHGNRTSREDSIQTGLGIYQRLKDRERFQFVIWSWPSDKIPGPRNDARMKARHCDTQAYYLATYLHDADVPTTLVGHSFGARIVTGTVQLLAGGEIAGRQFPLQDMQIRRLVLLAAAIDDHSFEGGRANDRVLTHATTTVTRNHLDPILQLYPQMFRPRGVPAMGLNGPTQATSCTVWDLSTTVGRSHALQDHLDVPGMFDLFTGDNDEPDS